jgi:hypothetical protein
MAGTDKRTGRAFGLYLNGTKIAETTSFSLSRSLGTVNVTSADSAAGEYLPTYTDGTVSFDYLEAPEATNLNSKDLLDFQKNKTRLAFVIANNGFGEDDFISGSGYITDISMEFPFDGVVSGSGTVQIDGDITINDIT